MLLEQLHPEKGTPDANIRADIVLVPGLGGHYIRTWQGDDDDKTLWPRDLLPKDIQGIRVLSFEYATTISGATSQAGIRDHANDLLAYLTDHREDDENAQSRPIIFVGHSLGGLIIKRAIRAAHYNKLYEPLAQASHGVMFFATPHYGVDVAHWQDFARHVLQCDAPIPGVKPTAEMSKQITENSRSLQDISEEFEQFHEELGLVSFLEESPMKGLDFVFSDTVRGRAHAREEHYEMISGDHLGICRFTKDELDQFYVVSKRMKALLDLAPKTMSYRCKQALRSLCSDDFDGFFSGREPTKGTCAWIEDRQEFKDWLDNKPGKQKLWISGPPGWGKSYLARYIIKTLMSNDKAIHCFLNESLPSRDNLQALLRTTIRQALLLAPELIDKFLLPQFQDTEKQDIWTEDALQHLWLNVMTGVTDLRPVAIVVDGFSELGRKCQDRFADCLRDFEAAASSPENLRLLLLSREAKASDSELGFKTYDMKPADTKDDIEKTVQESLAGLGKAKGYPRELLKKLRDGISGRAGGMYLWAALAADHLSRTATPRGEALKMLASLPRGVPGLYDQILGSILANPTDVVFIEQVLRWVSFQQEGLKAAELNIGQALGRAIAKYSGQRLDDQQLREFLEENVQSAVDHHCGHLIKFGGGRFELVHKSLKEYLKTKIEKGPQACYMEEKRSHATLASLCTTYLTMPFFKDSGIIPGYDKMPEELRRDLWESKVRRRVTQHEFVRYAALHWVRHLRSAGESPSSATNPRLDRNQKLLLGDKTSHYTQCWAEVCWYFTRWPRLEYPLLDCSVEQVLGCCASSYAQGNKPTTAGPETSTEPEPLASSTQPTQTRTGDERSNRPQRGDTPDSSSKREESPVVVDKQSATARDDPLYPPRQLKRGRGANRKKAVKDDRLKISKDDDITEDQHAGPRARWWARVSEKAKELGHEMVDFGP